MTVEHYIKFVLRFLKDNKVYYAYLYNAKKTLINRQKEDYFLDVSLNNYIETFSQRLYKCNTMPQFINFGLKWIDTIEGYKFWEKINEDFKREFERELKTEKLMESFYKKK